jgi:hypothetical protein
VSGVFKIESRSGRVEVTSPLRTFSLHIQPLTLLRMILSRI